MGSQLGPMDSTTTAALLQINREFYARFAVQFSQTRSPVQSGWQRLLAILPQHGRLLDVGCGNGRLALLLHQEKRVLDYIGIDSSPELLAIARSQDLGVVTTFVLGDVVAPGWEQRLPARSFDAIVALAVLHHIPSWQARARLLAQLSALLGQDAVMIVSTWQFMNEARLRRKIVPWSAAGLRPEQVESGDYLLDWQRGGQGLRYCHLVDEQELVALARQAGLQVDLLYYDDGRNRNLNLFAMLRRAG